jgi:hypothetical protein
MNLSLLPFLSKSRPHHDLPNIAKLQEVVDLGIARGISVAIVTRSEISMHEPRRRARGHIVVFNDIEPATTGPSAFTFDALSALRFADDVAVPLLPDAVAECDRLCGAGIRRRSIGAIVLTDDANFDAWSDLAKVFRRSKHAGLWANLPNTALTPAVRKWVAQIAADDIIESIDF